MQNKDHYKICEQLPLVPGIPETSEADYYHLDENFGMVNTGIAIITSKYN